MELIVIVVILALALHQFWTGHKKDKAGNVRAGRIHMFVSIILIIAGILFLSPHV
jgi:hypothetical protein